MVANNYMQNNRTIDWDMTNIHIQEIHLNKREYTNKLPHGYKDLLNSLRSDI